MLEAVIGALEIGTQIYGLAQQLPQDVSTWTLNRDQIPPKLSLLHEKLGLVSQQLDLFSSAISIEEVKTANKFQHSNISLDIKHCKRDVQKISNIIVNLDSRMRRRNHFPLPLRPIATALRAVENDQKELQESINKLAGRIETISNNTIKTTVWAPHVSKNCYIDLTSENQVKKLMDYILRAGPEPIGAVLVGGGGVGKTTAACQMARNIRIRARFTDGVLFSELGQVASKEVVINKIAHLVRLVGREDIQKKIQQLDSIEEAVTEAALVFQEKQCLIIFDDVWRKTFKSLDIISALSRLSTNESCKLLFTTRDSIYLTDDLTSDVSVLLDKRNAEESERILLQSAGLEKPEVEEDIYIFNKIIREADGLPLTLGLAGKALRQLANSEQKTCKLSVWFRYGIRNSRPHRPKTAINSVPESVQDELINSIELIQEQTKTIQFLRYFRALSVVPKSERIPYRVMCRVFGESHSAATKILESFEKYNIVTIEQGEENDSNRYVVIHDFVLDFARELADENGERLTLMMMWLSSFRNQGPPGESSQPSSTVGPFKEWLSRIDNDPDNYIYRHIFQILKTFSMYDEILWLINEPRWIQKQLEANGLHQMRSDLDLSLQCVLASNSMQRSEREVMRKWLNLLRAAITASYDAVSKCDWAGIIYTQLYGRLQSYRHSSTVIADFLKRVKDCAPRPFLLPGVGSFPSVPASYIEKIGYDGELLVMRQIKECVHIVSCIPAEDANDGLKNRLVLQVKDLANSSLVKVVIFRTGFTFRDYREKNGFGSMNEDGDKLVFGTKEGHVLILEAENSIRSIYHNSSPLTTDSKWKSTILRGHDDFVSSVAMSGDGARIVSASYDKTVRVWDKENKQWRSTMLNGHKDFVMSVSTSADGTRIVSGSQDNSVHVWDTYNNEWKSTVLHGHKNAVRSVVISGDGMRVVSGSEDKSVRVWDTHNDEWKSTVLYGHENFVRSIAMNDDGTRIISASRDHTVRIWDSDTNDWKSTVPHGYQDFVELVSMSRKGTRIISGSRDNTVRVWNADYDEWNSTVLPNHDDLVETVAMSGNGTRIVSGSRDNTVRVWDIYNDEWRSTILYGHNNWVVSVAISVDGSRIVSGSRDSMVCVWDTDNCEWRQSASLLVDQVVIRVAISENKDVIKATTSFSNKVWWTVFRGSWEECSEVEEVVFGKSFPIDGGALHAQLGPAHLQALRFIQNDLRMSSSACTADGFVAYGGVAPFIGFIHIVT